MMDKNSVKSMLNHWIEHNESHSRSFRERALQVEEMSKNAAKDISEAADLMDKSTELLRKALQDI